MAQTEAKYHDDVCIPKWRELITKFNLLAERPLSAATKVEAESIKADAMGTVRMTPRQVNGVVDRCNYYLAGTYGNTKTPQQLKGA